MAKRFRPKDEDIDGSELNLVPYLDIMMNLIMFMLFSTTGLAQLGAIDLSQPSYGGGPCEGCGAPEGVEVTLAISREGFTILAGGVPVPGSEGGVTIKRVGEGRYDFEALKERMVDLKARYPQQGGAIITAEEDTPYALMVASMDVIRWEALENGGRRALYPRVTLGAY